MHGTFKFWIIFWGDWFSQRDVYLPSSSQMGLSHWQVSARTLIVPRWSATNNHRPSIYFPKFPVFPHLPSSSWPQHTPQYKWPQIWKTASMLDATTINIINIFAFHLRVIIPFIISLGYVKWHKWKRAKDNTWSWRCWLLRENLTSPLLSSYSQLSIHSDHAIYFIKY